MINKFYSLVIKIRWQNNIINKTVNNEIMNNLMMSEHVQNIYGGEKKELRKDVLKLIMFGLSGPNLYQTE